MDEIIMIRINQIKNRSFEFREMKFINRDIAFKLNLHYFYPHNY